ncbi:DUF2993 domain-containing protein [Carbonactinospora thermoautotrophica]|nr:DUF2993 domain-containing protein [Carbonactinospora thermoautotrophica]
MRRLIRVLIVLAVLAALFAAADRIAVRLAQDMAASALAGTGRFGESPTVRIHGFPFLTQVVARRLDQVDVHGRGIHVKGGDLERLDARLYGVRVRDLETRDLLAERVTGTGLVTYPYLQQAVDRSGVEIGPGADGTVRVTSTIRVFGQPVKVRTDGALVAVSGNRISFQPERVTANGVDLGDSTLQRLAQRFELTASVPGLPAGTRITAVRPTEQGVEVDLAGENVSLRGAAVTTSD